MCLPCAGDLDLVVGNEVWELNYIENTGTSTAPAFVQRTGGANPFDGIEAEFPALGDFDGDGSGRVRQSINCDRTFAFRAGDPDLVGVRPQLRGDVLVFVLVLVRLVFVR